ncbi:MAG: polyphosphate polymerase domain-containing protein [Lachnospiraceae bacterium]|nr:polyphosphate polymerase domain-containing protein [Lachnospiraceae bacterium]
MILWYNPVMFEELSRYRHEHKYIESESDLSAAAVRLRAVMKKDPHMTEDKSCYNVRSLYFDDQFDSFLCENLNGTDERCKWRIRIYDRDSSYISLERKIRKGDLIAKQHCAIDTAVFSALMDKSAAISSSHPDLVNVFIKEMKTRILRPVVIVEYERTPFVCKEGNTRVTIDRNIRSSQETDALLADRPLVCRPLLSTGQNLLEVKYDAFLPVYIARTIEHGRMRRETFSKYALARRLPYNWRQV